ncbi:MAG TPA: hypothetical protein PLV92_07435, partial [Pirellulaceae bacterium]|nr:hypothetical protein [Pirellulaceae bacterium]
MQVLSEYYSRRVETGGAKVVLKSGDWREVRSSLRNELKIVPQRLKCLVVTVPDPIDSHLQLMFDQAVDAITRGLSRHRFTLDRFRLPWSDDLKSAATTRSNKGTGRDQPGALLFRRTIAAVEEETSNSFGADNQDLVLVMLVGETPISGVHKTALYRALDVAAGAAWPLDSEAAESEQYLPTLRVLGPEYSGSAPSLRQGLVQWWQAAGITNSGCDMRILSGSASSLANLKHLEASFVGADGHGPLQLRFNATVSPAQEAMNQLLDHLENVRRIRRKQIALLTEETGFGQALAPKTKTDARREGVDQSATVRATANDRSAAADPHNVPLVLPYPLALSRIRNEYEHFDSKPATAQTPTNPAGKLRRNLDLSLEAPPFASDALPAFSSAMAAATDVSLQQILTAVMRNDIRAVGLMGTDVRDKLFLARLIRQHIPDVQLFTLEADVLYNHADHEDDLKGMLVASSYPLFARGQRWMKSNDSSHVEVQFLTDTAQGICNASILLTEELFATTEKRVEPFDYRFPFSSADLRPPLWLLVVGESGMWPMEVTSRGGETRPAIETATTTATTTAGASNGGSKLRKQYVEEFQPTGEVTNASVSTEHWQIVAPSLIPLYSISIAVLALAEVFHLVNSRSLLPLLRRVMRRGGRRWRVARIGRTQLVRLRRFLRRGQPRDWFRRQFEWLRLHDAAAGEPGKAGSSAGLESRLLGVWLLLLAALSSLFLLCLPATLSLALVLQRDELEYSEAGVLRWTCGLALMLAGGVRISAGLVRVTSAMSRRGAWAGRAIPALVILAWVATIAVYTVRDSQSAVPAAQTARAMIFLERAGTYSSGVSPLLPLVLVATIFILWAIGDLRRRQTLSLFRPLSVITPEPVLDAGRDGPEGRVEDRHVDMGATRNGAPLTKSDDPQLAGIGSRFRELGASLERRALLPTEPGDWLALLLIVFAYGYIFLYRWVGTGEGRWYDWAFRLAIGASLLLLADLIIRLRTACGLFERLLRRMGQHPLVRVFARVPKPLAAKAAGQIFAGALHHGDWEPLTRLLRQMSGYRKRTDGRVQPVWVDGERIACEVETAFARINELPRDKRHVAQKLASELNARFSNLCATDFSPRLVDVWRNRPIEGDGGGGSGGNSGGGAGGGSAGA